MLSFARDFLLFEAACFGEFPRGGRGLPTR